MDEKTFNLIDKIANEHSRNIKRKPFGYLKADDLKNEIWVICLEKLKDYNFERGELENFLRVAVKNRLVNRYKDITKSVRPPCPRCPFFDPGNSPSDCSKFGDDRHLCTKWRNYQLSIESRNSLLNATEGQKERQTVDNVVNKVFTDELKTLILKHIDKEHRYDLEQLISNGKLSKQRLKRLKREIDKILEVHTNKKLVPITVKGK